MILEKNTKYNTSKKLNTYGRLIRAGKVNVKCDHSLNYDAFDVDTNGNKYSSRKYVKRAKRNNISYFCYLTLTLNNR